MYLERKLHYSRIKNKLKRSFNPSQKDFEYQIIDSFTDTIGNLITLDINIGNIKLKYINVYGPNTDSPAFYNKINDIIKSSNQDYIVICGDLNLLMDPEVLSGLVVSKFGI